MLVVRTKRWIWSAAIAVALPGLCAPAAGSETIIAKTHRPASGKAARHGHGSRQALYLLRATLLALDDANRTGNYSVFRELASPGFQQQHSAADLAMIFAPARRSRLDLGAVAIAEPAWSVAPVPSADGRLLLKGTLPSGTDNIRFELGFAAVAGHWRLIAVAIDRTPNATAATVAPRGAAGSAGAAETRSRRGAVPATAGGIAVSGESRKRS